MAMKPGKKVRKGGPKAAWKKKRAVGKTHRDKAQIQQFQDSYDQVSSICSVQFRSDLVGFILTHVLQNITQHPWTTYNVHWTTLHSNIDWNGKSLKPFLVLSSQSDLKMDWIINFVNSQVRLRWNFSGSVNFQAVFSSDSVNVAGPLSKKTTKSICVYKCD